MSPSTISPSRRVVPFDDNLVSQHSPNGNLSNKLLGSNRKVGDSSQLDKAEPPLMSSTPKNTTDDKWFWPINMFT